MLQKDTPIFPHVTIQEMSEKYFYEIRETDALHEQLYMSIRVWLAKYLLERKMFSNKRKIVGQSQARVYARNIPP